LNAQVAILAEENERLRQAVAARDGFLAVAAHELRNPMTPILGRVTLLRRLLARDALDLRDVATRLEALESSIVAFIKRATTLLDVSRAASDRIQVELSPVNVTEMVSLIADNLRPAATHAGSEISMRTDPDREVIALADPLALEQVVENLVFNAIKYGEGSPIQIAVSASAEGRLATVSVRDEGPGISREKQDRIFERFERAVQAGASATGYGIGLWLVRNLCDAMNGTIEIRSEIGQGSTFTVSLPLPPSENDR